MSQQPYGTPPPPYPGNPSQPTPSLFGAQSTYTPVQFNDPHTAGDPAQFYGKLIDPFGQPSEIMSRLCDAMFFYMDQNCPRNNGTGVLESDKLFWESAITDPTQDPGMVQALYSNIASLYDTLSIPYTLNPSRTAVLDRRGFLHFNVVDTRAIPDEAHKTWNKRLNTFKLIDPMTNLPFPTPLPRTSLPIVFDSVLNNAYISWVKQGIAKHRQQKMQAQYSQVLNTFNQSNAQMQTQIALAQTQAAHNTGYVPVYAPATGGQGGPGADTNDSHGGNNPGVSPWLNLAATVATNLLGGGDDGGATGGGTNGGDQSGESPWVNLAASVATSLINGGDSGGGGDLGGGDSGGDFSFGN